MFDEVVLGSEFFERLLKLDAEIAEEVRRGRCPVCGGPLHRGDYVRKPRPARGMAISDAHARRFSLCCGREGCRRRATPPSLRFLGRRVYVEAAVVAACVIARAMARARAIWAATGVPARTVRRWRSWWSGPFTSTAVFAQLSARFVVLDPATLPSALLKHGTVSVPEGLALIATWLAPITTISVRDGSRFLRAT